MILPKPFNHEAKKFWEACGFEEAEMNMKLQSYSPTFNELKISSKILEFIENLECSTREKVVLAYHVCGVQTSGGFTKVMEKMVETTALEMAKLREEIKQLKSRKKASGGRKIKK